MLLSKYVSYYEQKVESWK